MPRLGPAAIMPAWVSAIWTGPRWRWAALALGLALTTVSVLAAVVINALSGADAASLAMLFLAIGLVITGVVGAGLLDRLSARMMHGGLERQPLPSRNAAPPAARTEADQARRDRLTIRAGLVTLPMLVAFVALLFS